MGVSQLPDIHHAASLTESARAVVLLALWYITLWKCNILNEIRKYLSSNLNGFLGIQHFSKYFNKISGYFSIQHFPKYFNKISGFSVISIFQNISIRSVDFSIFNILQNISIKSVLEVFNLTINDTPGR